MAFVGTCLNLQLTYPSFAVPFLFANIQKIRPTWTNFPATFHTTSNKAGFICGDNYCKQTAVLKIINIQQCISKTIYSYKKVYLHWQLFVYITYKPQINHHLFIKAFRKTFWRRETLANIWASLAFQKKFKKLPFWIRLVNWMLNVFKPTKVV